MPRKVTWIGIIVFWNWKEDVSLYHIFKLIIILLSGFYHDVWYRRPGLLCHFLVYLIFSQMLLRMFWFWKLHFLLAPFSPLPLIFFFLKNIAISYIFWSKGGQSNPAVRGYFGHPCETLLTFLPTNSLWATARLVFSDWMAYVIVVITQALKQQFHLVVW